jgi:hypothetical protein
LSFTCLARWSAEDITQRFTYIYIYQHGLDLDVIDRVALSCTLGWKPSMHTHTRACLISLFRPARTYADIQQSVGMGRFWPNPHHPHPCWLSAVLACCAQFLVSITGLSNPSVLFHACLACVARRLETDLQARSAYSRPINEFDGIKLVSYHARSHQR